MKKEEGITLTSLIITVIIMIIIAGITTTAGLESMRSAEKTRMMTELQIIQEKVNTIYEKRQLNKENIEYYNSLGQDLSKVNQVKLEEALNGTKPEGYRYFSKEDLKQLDLENIEQEVIINFETRDVVSITGIPIDDSTYYRLSEIPEYEGRKIEYVNKNEKAPTFEVEVTKLAKSWQIKLKDIGNMNQLYGGILSYKRHISEEWILVGESNYFEVITQRFI